MYISGQMAMDQYLLIPFLGDEPPAKPAILMWTTGVQGFWHTAK